MHDDTKNIEPRNFLLCRRNLLICFTSALDKQQEIKFHLSYEFVILKGKGKSVPLHAWSGPEGSRKLRVPDYMTTVQDGGKVVSSTHRPPLAPGNTPGTHFC